MSWTDEILLKACGVPDREYLKIPVINYLYRLKLKESKLLMSIFIIWCVMTVTAVCFIDLGIMLNLLFLVIQMAVFIFLLMRLQFLRPQREVDSATYQLVVQFPQLSEAEKNQFQTLYLIKNTAIVMNDLYLLHEFNKSN